MTFLLNPYILLPSGPLTDGILFGGDQATGRLLLSGDQQTGTDLILRRFDPDFASVKLLVEPDGPDGAITFSDLSLTGHTLIRNGDTVQDAVIKKYGIASADFDGTGDYINCGGSSEHYFSNDDFTVEFWTRMTAEPGVSFAWVTKWNNTGSQGQWSFQYDVTVNTVVMFVSTTGSNNFNANFDLDTDGVSVAQFFNSEFHHVAFTREGVDGRVFVDGILGSVVLNMSTTALFDNSGTDLLIGARRLGAGVEREVDAHIAGVRVTNGVARYTSNFTPPAFQFNRS